METEFDRGPSDFELVLWNELGIGNSFGSSDLENALQQKDLSELLLVLKRGNFQLGAPSIDQALVPEVLNFIGHTADDFVCADIVSARKLHL